MLFKRPLYLTRITPYMGTDLIKVLTGQRRVGKSYLLLQVQEKLLEENPELKIVYSLYHGNGKADLGIKEYFDFQTKKVYKECSNVGTGKELCTFHF